MLSFDDIMLQPATRGALAHMEITEPTPIQAEAIPTLLAGKDLVGQSATGSGKTLSYCIPLVERLAKDRTVQALILVPTRELALQVNTVLSKLAACRRLTTALLVGGRPYGAQISALRYGSHIIVGTPGRVKDHLDRGTLALNHLRMCILDEADQMLDSGFAPIIEEILATTPDTRQMALFSATIPNWVEKLQHRFLKEPVKITITPAEGEQSTIEQIVYQVSQDKKMAALCTLLRSTLGESSLVFGKTKYGVEKLGKQLTKLGFTVGTLHGNKSQRAREEVLSAFRYGQVQTLLATNVAARGLDIKGIYQVINYELPESSDLFTHRIGRTGRMGQQGKAITLLAPADVPKWRRMARSLGQAVTLQQLAIDEDAMMPMPDPRSEVALLEGLEQSDEQPPLHVRGQVVPDQERGRRTRSGQAGRRQTESEPRRRQKRNAPGKTRTWQSEDVSLSERSRADKAKSGRRAPAQRPLRDREQEEITIISQPAVRSAKRAQRNKALAPEKAVGKRKTVAFASARPQSRPAGRKRGAGSTQSARR